jgi:heterodisulfide reductase subunit B
MGLELVELDDWNCCGSSSAHSLDHELALALAARNLALAPPDRPLLIMCPGCFKNLFSAHLSLRRSPDLRRAQERKWGAPISPELKIVNFLEILRFLQRLEQAGLHHRIETKKSLAGLKIAPYYGCMNMFPPEMRRA